MRVSRVGSRCQEWTADGGWQKAPRQGSWTGGWGEGHVEGQTDSWKGHCGAAYQGYTPTQDGVALSRIPSRVPGQRQHVSCRHAVEC